MKFSRKIFITIFLSTVIVGGSLIWAGYSYVSEQTKESFIARYSVFSKVLGDTLSRSDVSTEALMLNAANVVAEKDRQHGLLSTEQLKSMRKGLSVTHIFVVDKNGKFIRSTNEDPSLIPNAYSFCPKYKNLILGTSNVEATPIIHPHPEPKPYKFLFIPSHDRKRLIEVGIRVDFIAKTLTEALGSDPNLASLSVYSPKGLSFGRFSAQDVEFNNGDISLPDHFPSHLEEKDRFIFYTKVKSSHTQCCQCNVSKTSLNGEYYYVLKSEISKKELSAVLSTTKTSFILLGIINLILALVFGQLFSRHLVKNIEKAARKIRSIKESGSLKGRIKLEGCDEVSYLTNELDHMLDSLEESQAKIIEAEKVEAKVQIAREVSHNIRSPIVAIEMMLPSMQGLPERIKKVLKSSVKEIKDLSQKLSEKNKDFALSMKSQRAHNDLVFLPAVIDEVVCQKQAEYSGNSNVSFKFVNLGDVSDEFVKLDSVDFKGILSNLINNALESYSNGGRVMITCKPESGNCVVSVIDQGSGIPQEYIDKLGREPITFKGEKARGAGLVQAFRKVESWSGSIKVSSELGKGTTVDVIIPRYCGEPCQEVTPSINPQEEHGI